MIREVALSSGLSGSYLSQLERGLSSASIRVLARVADALDVGIAELFPGVGQPEKDGPIKIAHISDRKHVDFPATGISKEVLTPFDQSPRLDIYIMTFAVGGTSGEEPFTHQGEEAGYVLEGGIELEVGGQKEILAEGDSFRFTSSHPHRYRNAGTRPARAVWINFREK
jgi:quercetin dioxygenase-like cupin family protein